MPAIYDSDGELIWSGIDIFDKFDTFVFKVQVVDGGTKVLYLTAHNEKDLSVARRVGYQGGECKVAWNGIAEREIESGDLTFEWMSKDHIGMDESVMYEHDPSELCGEGVRHPQDYL